MEPKRKINFYSLSQYIKQHIWPIFNKYTHICERKMIEMIKGEISQISSLTQFHFLFEKNSQKRKQIYNGECFYPFSIRNTSHNIYCKYYHPGVPQCKIPGDNKPCSLMYLVQVQGLPPVF